MLDVMGKLSRTLHRNHATRCSNPHHRVGGSVKRGQELGLIPADSIEWILLWAL
jgi:hypothetical protein